MEAPSSTVTAIQQGNKATTGASHATEAAHGSGVEHAHGPSQNGQVHMHIPTQQGIVHEAEAALRQARLTLRDADEKLRRVECSLAFTECAWVVHGATGHAGMTAQPTSLMQLMQQLKGKEHTSVVRMAGTPWERPISNKPVALRQLLKLHPKYMHAVRAKLHAMQECSRSELDHAEQLEQVRACAQPRPLCMCVACLHTIDLIQRASRHAGVPAGTPLPLQLHA